MKNLANNLYGAAQIREIERIAIEDLHIPGIELMRKAGLAAFTALTQRWPQCRAVTVFCGPGNNAGDGYVLAKCALEAAYQVTVYTVDDIGLLKHDAKTACQAYLALGGKITPLSDFSGVSADTVIVDALLGTGLNRQVGEDIAQAISVINSADVPVLAVDIPSGLHADTGCVLGAAVKAQVTVTFIALKCGLFTGEAVDYCGDIQVADLALPQTVFAQIAPAALLLDKTPLPPRDKAAHKGRFGHALLIGGNTGYTGAIRLAAEAALRTGAGLVSVASRAAHASLLNISRPELMCHGVENADELQVLLEKANVVVIGPGLGQDEWANRMFELILAIDKPCVIDADALNLLAKQPVKCSGWVLTPHPGEAARLLLSSASAINANRFVAIGSLQSQYGGVCVLKGAGSLISDGGGVHVATTGNPGMASGGMGDVLSGIIGGLIAQGLPAIEAAKLGVYVHGEAADLAAAEAGETGLLASDLFSKLRVCLNVVP